MRRRPTLLATLPAALLVVAGLAGCGSTSAPAAGAGPGAPSGTITVFAAASLTETFTKLGTQFQADHSGTTVKFNFGPSSGLAQQITNGAPADVFASASSKNMDQVVQAGDAGTPITFAKNQMAIAVPPDNPARITGLADLAKPGVKLAVCQAQVPCGKVAAEVFQKAGVTVKPVTEGVDVKAVLTLVRTGEVDAGMVYVTDVKAAGAKVTGIDIPADQNASTSYPIAALSASKNPTTAQAFVDFVLSSAARSALAEAGFSPP